MSEALCLAHDPTMSHVLALQQLPSDGGAGKKQQIKLLNIVKSDRRKQMR
jgi:hypothetical protein